MSPSEPEADIESQCWVRLHALSQSRFRRKMILFALERRLLRGRLRAACLLIGLGADAGRFSPRTGGADKVI